MSNNATYNSIYPKILVDSYANSVNESLKKVLTIEEYYDLTHHSHKLSSLVSDEGEMNYNEMQESIRKLVSSMADMQSIIKAQQDKINKLTETVDFLTKEMENTANVSDWDVETPGNQDKHGNDLGTLMGFNMTEI